MRWVAGDCEGGCPAPYQTATDWRSLVNYSFNVNSASAFRGQTTSVRLVDAQNLDATFGKFVRLAGIHVELTEAPVAKSLQDRLPWLQDDLALALDANFKPTINPTLSQRLRHADFQRTKLE